MTNNQDPRTEQQAVATLPAQEAPAAVPMCSEQAVLHALTLARSETHKQGDAALWQAFGRAMWRQFNAMAGAAQAPAEGEDLLRADWDAFAATRKDKFNTSGSQNDFLAGWKARDMRAAQPQPKEIANPNAGLGIPPCGGPLCGHDHHPLCKHAPIPSSQAPAPAQPVMPGRDWLEGMADAWRTNAAEHDGDGWHTSADAFRTCAADLERALKLNPRDALPCAAVGAEQPWQAMLYAPRDGSKIELLVEHREYWIALKAGRADGYRQECEGHWVDFNGGGWSWMGTAGQPIGWRPLRTGPASDVPVQGTGDSNG